MYTYNVYHLHVITLYRNRPYHRSSSPLVAFCTRPRSSASSSDVLWPYATITQHKWYFRTSSLHLTTTQHKAKLKSQIFVYVWLKLPSGVTTLQDISALHRFPSPLVAFQNHPRRYICYSNVLWPIFTITHSGRYVKRCPKRFATTQLKVKTRKERITYVQCIYSSFATNIGKTAKEPYNHPQTELLRIPLRLHLHNPFYPRQQLLPPSQNTKRKYQLMALTFCAIT